MTNKTLKTTLRKQICQERGQLPLALQQEASAQINQQLLTLTAIINAKQVALYSATSGEANPFELHKTLLAQHKTCLLPIVKQHGLAFLKFHADEKLIKSRLGILEPPENNPEVAIEKIDVVLLPLVGFDATGNRLGRGAGHYDRALQFLQDKTIKKPYLIGIGYEFQRINKLPTDAWDISLQLVVTEKQIYHCHKETTL